MESMEWLPCRCRFDSAWPWRTSCRAAATGAASPVVLECIIVLECIRAVPGHETWHCVRGPRAVRPPSHHGNCTAVRSGQGCAGGLLPASLLLRCGRRTVGCPCGSLDALPRMCRRLPCRTKHSDHVAVQKEVVVPPREQRGGTELTSYTSYQDPACLRAGAARSQALARRRRLLDLLLRSLVQLLACAAGGADGSTVPAAQA